MLCAGRARRPPLRRDALGSPCRFPEDEGTLVRPSPACPLRLLRQLALVAWALSAAACATWQARPHVLDTPLRQREQVKLWAHGTGHQVHGVQVRGDSVIAVSFIRPPTCDSCALRFARTEIDSVQVRAFDLRRSIVAAVILAPVLYLLYLGTQVAQD